MWGRARFEEGKDAVVYMIATNPEHLKKIQFAFHTEEMEEYATLEHAESRRVSDQDRSKQSLYERRKNLQCKPLKENLQKTCERQTILCKSQSVSICRNSVLRSMEQHKKCGMQITDHLTAVKTAAVFSWEKRGKSCVTMQPAN